MFFSTGKTAADLFPNGKAPLRKERIDVVSQIPIRAEWMYQVRSTCQSFHCKVVDADRADFEHALIWLGSAAPEPESLQEADHLRDQLKLASVEASVVFHQQYHGRLRQNRCYSSALEVSFRAWGRHHEDPRTTFNSWGKCFLSAFDATHPHSQIERAAAMLRAGFRDRLRLDHLASTAAISRSALTRGFRAKFGMTCGEYLTRTRLRWFIEHARTPHARVSHLATEAGYASYHNLADALFQRTGLKPSAIQTLSENEASELLATELSLSKPCRFTAHPKPPN